MKGTYAMLQNLKNVHCEINKPVNKISTILY